MSNFKDDILEAANGEEIIGIVIGDIEREYHSKGKPEYKHIINKLITWDEALPILDYEYDTGFGAPDCQAITAWTANYVLFVDNYDGATSVVAMPRNPIEHAPIMPGGG